MDRVNHDTEKYYAEEQRAEQEYEQELDEMGYYDEERDYAEMVIENVFCDELRSFEKYVFGKGLKPEAYWLIWKYASEQYQDDTGFAMEQADTAYDALFFLVKEEWDLEDGIFDEQQKMAIMFAYIHEQKEFKTIMDYVDVLVELKRMKTIATRG